MTGSQIQLSQMPVPPFAKGLWRPAEAEPGVRPLLSPFPARGGFGSLQVVGRAKCMFKACGYYKIFKFMHGIIVLPSKPKIKG